MEIKLETQVASSNGADVPVGTGRKVRLVGLQMELNLVVDDGEVLEPLRVQPIQVTASAWPGFDLETQIADIQRQVDQSV